MDSFIALRRENSAVRLCFSLIEYCLGTDLPNEVFENPTFMEIYWAGVDLICWSNVSLSFIVKVEGIYDRLFKDLYSYDMEQSKGISGNNIITVLMKNKNMDLQAAADYVGIHCQDLMECLISARHRLPSWGASVDAEVTRYVQSLGCWVKGNLE